MLFALRLQLGLLVAVLLSFGGVIQTEAAVLYAVSGAGNSESNLYQVDPVTAATTLVGATGFSHVTGLAFNPVTGVLYGHQSDFAFSGNTGLMTIDINTGAGTIIGATGHQIPDMTFSSNGTLYAWSEGGVDGNEDGLFTLNLNTGAATLVGESGIATGATGLASDSNGVLWVKPSNSLYTVNPSNGLATFNKFLDNSPNNALAFDQNDVAYTVIRPDGSTGASHLATIDMTTGVVTTIGDMGVAGISALAFQTEATVPEPASIAIWSLSALGCAISAYRRRKLI